MPWLPIQVSQLRIGLYVKVDHSWMEHPFVRNTFMISSPSEIAIVQNNGLTKLFYDPVRSQAAPLGALEHPSHVIAAESDAPLDEDIAEDEKALLKEKTIHIEGVINHQKSLNDAERNYTSMTKQCSVMITMAKAGEPEGMHVATQMATSMMTLLEHQSVALSLVSSVEPAGPGQELAMQAMNVCALALLTGKTMNLTQLETQHLGLGALFHNLGKNRISETLHTASDADLSPAELKMMQLYPRLGSEILGKISGVPRMVIDIVDQHRECLDGSGYPKGLFNGNIAKLSRVVGTITEYNFLTSDRRTSKSLTPTQALSHLYTNMKRKYGSDVINPFIATITVYPPGSFLQMSDGHIGLVVKTNSHERLRPVVMLYDPTSSHSDASVIDLARERSLTIVSCLEPQKIAPQVLKMLNPGLVNGYTLTSN